MLLGHIQKIDINYIYHKKYFHTVPININNTSNIFYHNFYTNNQNASADNKILILALKY